MTHVIFLLAAYYDRLELCRPSRGLIAVNATTAKIKHSEELQQSQIL
jgi:hypothetical protein